MAESTLSLAITDLKAEIGAFLGYGRGADLGERTWTTPQENNITSVLKSGLSQFYTPPPIAPGERAHEWSFLSPFSTVSLASGGNTAALPDDFGYITGKLYIQDQSGYNRVGIDVLNEGLIRARIAAQPDTTGRPHVAAVSPIDGTTATEGTRYNLIVWPKADANYTLAFEYKHLPNMLTGGLPFPPGGQQHAETIKAACIAAAELYLDDMKGPRFQFFMERLAASVEADRRGKGLKFGYNGDNSRHLMRRGGGRHWWGIGNPVTYNGDSFDA